MVFTHMEYRPLRAAVIMLPLCWIALCGRSPAAPRDPAGNENDERPGIHLFVTVSGASLQAAERELLREVQPAGVVLMGDSIRSSEQTRRLIADIKRAAGLGTDIFDLPLIAVDQEGGRINRLNLADSPSAAEIGAGGDPNDACMVGRRYGTECRRLGIAIILAPVMDIAEPGATHIIEDRSFGGSPALVTAMGLAFAKGVMEAGVIPVAKHFPGHGGTKQDSHQRLALLTKQGDSLRRTLWPFEQAVRQQIPAIMVGHIACPQLERGASVVPASLSRALVTELLRKTWGYSGLVMTDDLNMGAIGQDVGSAAVSALRAGNDIAMICNPDPQCIRQTCRTISESLSSGKLDDTALDESALRLARLQHWLRLSSLVTLPTPDVTTSEDMCLAKLPNTGVAPETDRGNSARAPTGSKVPAGTAARDATASSEANDGMRVSDSDAISISPTKKKALQPPAKGTASAAQKAASAKPNSASANDKRSSVNKAKGGSIEYETYTVKQGETLYTLAKRFKVSVEQLQKVNHLSPGQALHAGKKLTVPRERAAQ